MAAKKKNTVEVHLDQADDETFALASKMAVDLVRAGRVQCVRLFGAGGRRGDVVAGTPELADWLEAYSLPMLAILVREDPATAAELTTLLEDRELRLSVADHRPARKGRRARKS